MNNIVMQSDVKKTKSQSFKNKNIKTDLLLMQMFDFTYAGKAHVFIHKSRDKYELVHQGVHLVEDIYTFSKNYTARYKFESLYMAIVAFNHSVQIITSSMDWYNPDCFEGYQVYDEIFLKD